MEMHSSPANNTTLYFAVDSYSIGTLFDRIVEATKIFYLFNNKWRMLVADKDGNFSGDGRGRIYYDKPYIKIYAYLNYPADSNCIVYMYNSDWRTLSNYNLVIGKVQSNKLNYTFEDYVNIAPKSMSLQCSLLGVLTTLVDINGDGVLYKTGTSEIYGSMTYNYSKSKGTKAAISLSHANLTNDADVKILSYTGTYPCVSASNIGMTPGPEYPLRIVLPHKNIIPNSVTISVMQSKSTGGQPFLCSDFESMIRQDNGKGGLIPERQIGPDNGSSINYSTGELILYEYWAAFPDRRLWYITSTIKCTYLYTEDGLTKSSITGIDIGKMPLQPVLSTFKVGQKIAIMSSDLATIHTNTLVKVVGKTLYTIDAIPSNFAINSLVTNLIPKGTAEVTVPVNFTQESWTGVWNDTRIGNPASGSYDFGKYPLLLTHAGTLTDRYYLLVTGYSGNNLLLSLMAERQGTITTNLNSSVDIAVKGTIFSNYPVFTLSKDGWGTQPSSSWAIGNIIRLNTIGSYYPFWALRSINAVAAKDADDSAKLGVICTIYNTYTTFNDQDKSQYIDLSPDFLSIKRTQTPPKQFNGVRALNGKKTGKYYIEIISYVNDTYGWIGFGQTDTPIEDDGSSWELARNAFMLSSAGSVLVNRVGKGGAAVWAKKTAMLAIDFTAKQVWTGVNGVWTNPIAQPGIDIAVICTDFLYPMAFAGSYVPTGYYLKLAASPSVFQYTVPKGFTPGWPQEG